MEPARRHSSNESSPPVRPGLPFVNADRIASDRFPGQEVEQAYAAAAIAAATRQALIDARLDFCAETVFSHQSKIDLISVATIAGYDVVMHVVMIPLALSGPRVASPSDRRRPPRSRRQADRSLRTTLAEHRRRRTELSPGGVLRQLHRRWTRRSCLVPIRGQRLPAPLASMDTRTAPRPLTTPRRLTRDSSSGSILPRSTAPRPDGPFQSSGDAT